MAGAPNLSRSYTKIESLSFRELKEMQELLKQRGFDVGEVDGKLGANTRKAVKEVQIKLGLPADSYPTAELLSALRGRS
jgi:peptidoglycan hydrolase-like protein with peptidoglycan-binding domain